MPKAETKKKSSAKSSKVAGAPRMRKTTRKQARSKAKKEARTQKPLVNSFKLTAQVVRSIAAHWKPLGGIVLVYLILNILFASGISDLSSSVNSIKTDLNSNGDSAHPIVAGASAFLTLITSSGASSSSTGSALQTVLIVLESLVIIWALRHLLAGQKITVKAAYYNSMAPLIPFLLVAFFIIIQLLPITFGSVALSAIASSLGTVSGLWTAVFVIVFLLLGAWSVYMVSASIFAVYIVTLPDMQPRDALRSAKKLVQYRRWAILRRVLFLPILILLVMAVIMIPLILYATFFAAPVFYLLGMLAILFVHAYLYSLYRGLLA
ncbi:MAG TPA: hypothetical protein VFT49_00340 [Candidatus Saccharimonadales bacterium]|nr:hypothetical protein [Candidatus Saccharimonadales bacterium]